MLLSAHRIEIRSAAPGLTSANQRLPTVIQATGLGRSTIESLLGSAGHQWHRKGDDFRLAQTWETGSSRTV